jgi:hypothetical protein
MGLFEESSAAFAMFRPWDWHTGYLPYEAPVVLTRRIAANKVLSNPLTIVVNENKLKTAFYLTI